MNMVIQAGALSSDILRQIAVAGTDLVELMNQPDRVLNRSGTGVWPEIDRFIFFKLTRKKDMCAIKK